MNYELFNLEFSLNKTLTDPANTETEEELSVESERISAAIRLAMVNLKTDLAVIYLRQHQNGILSLFEKIEDNQTKDSTSQLPHQLLKIFEVLSMLLTEIEDRFPDCFDFSTLIPVRIASEKIRHIWLKWEDLAQQLSKNSFEREFIEDMEKLIPINGIQNAGISFHRIKYILDFIQSFSRQIQDHPTEEILEIIIYMISANFNHPGFYNYCNNFIQSQKDFIETMEGQFRLLSYLKKRFEQIVAIIPEHYQPNLPPIQQSMVRLVNAEIAYLESIDLISNDIGMNTKHFKVDFTVRQLAIFISLQSASGIILSDKPKLIHEYVTDHYSTPDQKRISEKSFKNAFYGNNSADLDKVLEKITQMLVIGQQKY